MPRPTSPARRAAAAVLLALLAACSPSSGGPGLLDTVFAVGDPARFAWSVNMGDGTLSSFVVAPGTGRLTHRGYFSIATVDTMPEAVAVHTDREHLFLTSASTDTVTVLRADSTTGALSVVSFVTGIGPGPHDVVSHPRRDFVYASSAGASQVSGYSFDRQTGALTPVPGSPRVTAGSTPTQLLMDPRGRYLACLHYQIGLVQTWQIDQDNGRLFDATQFLVLTPGQIGGAAIDNVGGNLYLSLSNFDTVLRVEIDGSFRPISRESRPAELDPADESRPSAVTLHPTGNFLYTLNQGTQQVFYFSVDRATLELAAEGFLGPTAGAQQIFFEPTGAAAYLVDPAEGALARYVWDSQTGALEFREETRTRPTPLDLGFLQAEDPPNLRVDELYVTSRVGDEVRSFAVNTTTGQLVPLGDPTPTGNAPLDLAVGIASGFAFSANSASADLSRFAVGADGRLEPLGDPTPLTGVPSAVAVEPSGRFVYVASSVTEEVRAFAIQPGGELLEVGAPLPTGDDPTAAAVDPTGRFLYLANGGQQGGGPGGTISIYAIDPRNGALSQVIPGGTAPGGPLALAFAPTGGRLYAPVVQLDQVLPYELSPALGTLTLIGTGTPALTEPTDLVLSPTGRYAYVTLRNGSGGGAVQLFDVRVTDGALYNALDESDTPRQTLPVGPDPIAVAIDPRENFLYVLDQGSDEVWRLAIESDGTLTALGTNPAGALPSDLELTTRVD